MEFDDMFTITSAEDDTLKYTDNYSEVYVTYEVCRNLVIPPRMTAYNFVGYWTYKEYKKNRGLFRFFDPLIPIHYHNPTMIHKEIANMSEFDYMYGHAICPALTYEQMFDIFRFFYNIDIYYKYSKNGYFFGKISTKDTEYNFSGYKTLASIKQKLSVELIKIQKAVTEHQYF